MPDHLRDSAVRLARALLAEQGSSHRMYHHDGFGGQCGCAECVEASEARLIAREVIARYGSEVGAPAEAAAWSIGEIIEERRRQQDVKPTGASHDA
jgi:hypothetical protein